MVAVFIPTSSDHDRSRFPIATAILVSVNFLVYLLVNFVYDFDIIVQQYGFVAAYPQWYTWVTHIFLHAGWPQGDSGGLIAYVMAVLHIGLNMSFLWFAGGDLEDVMGTTKFIAAYFLGGLSSAFLYWLTSEMFRPESYAEPAVGASGAVAALLGLYAMRFPRYKIRIWYFAYLGNARFGVERVSSLIFIGVFFLVDIVSGIATLRAGGGDNVARWGHIGGFLLGFIYGLATRQYKLGEEEYRLKEADHLFYKQKWYPAMEAYQKLLQKKPRCAEGHIKLALCWECSGAVNRAEKVLQEALEFYRQQGWTTEANMIDRELTSMRAGGGAAEQSTTPTESRAPVPAPNLMFRRELPSKGKSND